MVSSILHFVISLVKLSTLWVFVSDIIVWDVVASSGLYRLRGHKVFYGTWLS